MRDGHSLKLGCQPVLPLRFPDMVYGNRKLKYLTVLPDKSKEQC